MSATVHRSITASSSLRNLTTASGSIVSRHGGIVSSPSRIPYSSVQPQLQDGLQHRQYQTCTTLRFRGAQSALLRCASNASNCSFSPRTWHNTQHALFSTSPLHRSKIARSRATGAARPAARPSISVQKKSQEKEAMTTGLADMLNVQGVLPGTFVMPTGSGVPNLRTQTKERLRLEYRRLLTMVSDKVKNYWFSRWYTKPKITLDSHEDIVRVAMDLHKKIFTAFGKGDLAPVKDQMSLGFYRRLSERIAQREPDTFMHWEVDKYLETPRVMSCKLAGSPAPDGKGSPTDRTGLLQAVVKIQSRQKLATLKKARQKNPRTGKWEEVEDVIDARGRVAATTLEAINEPFTNLKETTEYVVVQRPLIKSTLGTWNIWGTTEETTLAKLEMLDQKMRREARKRAQAGPSKSSATA